MDLSKVKEWTIGGKQVKILTIDGAIYWQKKEEPKYEPFYVENVSGSDNSLTLTKNGTTAPDIKLEYSTDNQQWQEWVNCQTTPLPIEPNGRVYLRGVNKYFGYDKNAYNFFNCTNNFNVGGDITTLLTHEGKVLDLNGRLNTFVALFKNSITLQNAKDLILPSTTLTQSSYDSMFDGCTALTTTPVLPATTLGNYCYQSMFNNCTALTTAPKELPATTLSPYCYNNMFRGCTALTTAPTLPATTLAKHCYGSMFNGCTALTQVPRELPATTLADWCYNNMFRGCTALTTAPVLPATILTSSCYYYMFYGCTALTTAPELPATTLADWCYNTMFTYCSSLTTAPQLPATTLAKDCYGSMFYNCTALNKVEIKVTNWNESYTRNWLQGVASSGTITKPKELTNMPIDNPSGVPTGWTTIDK